MQGFRVVADNTTLVYLTKLDTQFPVFNLLKVHFSQFHVPQEVKREYRNGAKKEPIRNHLLNRIEGPDKFWTDCHEFDPYVKAFLDTADGIDSGESEVFAQYMSIKARFIISDDGPFIKAIKQTYPHTTILTTLHVLCMLEIHGFIADWADCLKKYAAIRKFTATELRKAYVEAATYSGVNKEKKEISRKCSVKKLGIS